MKGVSICLESSAESREYMLAYFWGKGTYFYWGDGSIYLLGRGWVEIFGGGGGGMNTPIPPGFAPLGGWPMSDNDIFQGKGIQTPEDTMSIINLELSYFETKKYIH